MTSILDIDAEMLRQYMLYLEKKGHNPGGEHVHYRVIVSPVIVRAVDTKNQVMDSIRTGECFLVE